MDEQGNQFNDDEDHVSRILEQCEIDEINMKDLNVANRSYRKCVAGKCPPHFDRKQKMPRKSIGRSKRPKLFASPKLQDQKLTKIWVEKGRARRIQILEDELKEVRTKNAVASAKTHVEEQEKNFKGIGRTIKELETMDEEIKKAKSEIAHLKSQIVRVDQKKQDLSRETECEDQFANHWSKANRQLEIYENRVQRARQHEGEAVDENQKLRKLIEDMLFDRSVFNSYWTKTVKKIKDRRKFLLDMIERTSQAFNEGADTLDSYKKLQSRRAADKDFHISEMIKMERQIDANQIMNMFLGQKGKKRDMAPLEPREVHRRENFKLEYNNRLNLYNGIIESIKKFTGMPDVPKAVNHYLREENDGFQFYKYLNEMNHQIECLSNNLYKSSIDIIATQDYNSRKLRTYELRIEELHKQVHSEINKTFELRDRSDRQDDEIKRHLEGIMESMKILECDLSPVEKHLGNHRDVTIHNVNEFFSILETRLNDVLSTVYCDQRLNDDTLTEDPSLTVKSIKRELEKPVHVEDVIATAQCAECAKGEDVNLYDETTVYPLDHDTIRANMRKKVESPEIAFRLHSLSKCNLPRSGVIASRRYAE